MKNIFMMFVLLTMSSFLFAQQTGNAAANKNKVKTNRQSSAATAKKDKKAPQKAKKPVSLERAIEKKVTEATNPKYWEDNQPATHDPLSLTVGGQKNREVTYDGQKYTLTRVYSEKGDKKARTVEYHSNQGEKLSVTSMPLPSNAKAQRVIGPSGIDPVLLRNAQTNLPNVRYPEPSK